MDLGQLFHSFRKEAFRLERLPQYMVDEEVEALRLFHDTGTIPQDFNKEWAELVKANVDSGKRMLRLRLLSDELTDYECFELTAYPKSIKAGEDIRTDSRSLYPESQDFWVFDMKWIGLMNYDSDGRFLSATTRKLTESDVKQVQYWKLVYEGAKSLLQN